MALDEKFSEAFVNLDYHRVIGYKLKPFSLWHRFLLEFFDSPLITGEKPNVESILQAIQICRVSFPKYPKPQSLLSKIRLLCHAFKPEVEGEKFASYVEDYAAFPELWNKEDGEETKKSSAPETLSMAVQLMEMGFCEKDSWNMPIGKAFWYTSISALLKGADIDFVTQEEREMSENKDEILRKMREAEAEMKKQMKEQASGI